jgi:hypothetical protein
MPLKPLLKISPKSVLAGLVLHDQLGRIVEVRKNVNANSSLKIGDGYKPGMYFVEILQDNEKAILNFTSGSQRIAISTLLLRLYLV